LFAAPTLEDWVGVAAATALTQPVRRRGFAAEASATTGFAAVPLADGRAWRAASVQIRTDTLPEGRSWSLWPGLPVFQGAAPDATTVPFVAPACFEDGSRGLVLGVVRAQEPTSDPDRFKRVLIEARAALAPSDVPQVVNGFGLSATALQALLDDVRETAPSAWAEQGFDRWLSPPAPTPLPPRRPKA